MTTNEKLGLIAQGTVLCLCYFVVAVITQLA